MKKKHQPTKQELQEEFHTDLSFEDALRHIANISKEDVEANMEVDGEDEPPEVEPCDEPKME